MALNYHSSDVSCEFPLFPVFYLKFEGEAASAFTHRLVGADRRFLHKHYFLD